MRKNLATNATNEELTNAADLWKQIHYLDPDLQTTEGGHRSNDGIAIMIAFLFALLLVSGLCLYLRTL